MPSLYDRLRTTTTRLLDKYQQGTVEIGSTVSGAGTDPWDPPTVTTTWAPVDAVVKGVSQKYVDGINIVSSDLEVVTQIASIDAGDLVRIDGRVVAVLMIMPIPAAGEPVATRLIVRG